MKRIVMIGFAILLILGCIVYIVQNNKGQKSKGVVAQEAVAGENGAQKVAAQQVEVYYFHFTRRCPTCMAVETESKNNLVALYPKQVKGGSVVFKSINLDDKSSEVIAKKCQANGQSLLVISGTKRVDLTSEGFMYARNSPDKFKAKIKSVIDPMLGGK
ncbi:nitrophenyl compound nitroreductase subunit ArsF family protein [Bacteroides sedimenti]|uniref:Thioredoxin domain-containing protein n=1 Tax=Bacteroides sedimenti TaxID=2136147 RepID=A0ABM8IH63_9BACE